MSSISACSFCGRIVHLSFDVLRALRMIGEPIYCDPICFKASRTGLFEKVTAVLPQNIDQALCDHRAGAVKGRCLDCGTLVG